MPPFRLQPERGQLHVPADSPFFDGHFPGAPILPGAGLLQAVLQCVDRLPAFAGRDVEIERVRFQQPVAPGADVSLTVVAAGDDRATFIAETAAGVVAAGGLRIATR